MATTALISVGEYLNTTYHPDCDYIDGEIQERNVGELEHSLMQTTVVNEFGGRVSEWKALAVVEQRVQVTATRYRVPDITVLHPGQGFESIITRPPLIAIEGPLPGRFFAAHEGKSL